MTDSAKRAPNPAAETPIPLGDKFTAEVEDLFHEKFESHLQGGEEFQAELFTDENDTSGLFRLSVGKAQKPHVFEFFVRGVPGKYPDGAIGLAVSFGVSAIEEYFDEDRGAYFHLDFVGHPVGPNIVFARSQVRDLEAERLAEAWLSKHGEA